MRKHIVNAGRVGLITLMVLLSLAAMLGTDAVLRQDQLLLVLIAVVVIATIVAFVVSWFIYARKASTPTIQPPTVVPHVV